MEILEAAPQKLWKYVSKHLQLPQEAQICDPRQTTTLFGDINIFPGVFAPNQCHGIDETGESRLYRESFVPNSRDFDIPRWSEGVPASVTFAITRSWKKCLLTHKLGANKVNLGQWVWSKEINDLLGLLMKGSFLVLSWEGLLCTLRWSRLLCRNNEL